MSNSFEICLIVLGTTTLWAMGGTEAAIAGASATQATNGNGLQCQRITVAACQGLGYNMTALPNLAGHTNQLEAELRIAKLLPLIEIDCSQRARFLLCSSLFPLCTPDVPRPVTACKSLCETVKSECSAAQPELMLSLWPDYLRCEQLPQPEKHELCMQIPQEATSSSEATGAGPEATSTSVAASAAAAAAAAAEMEQQQQTLNAIAASSPAQQQQQFYWSWMASKMPAHFTKSLSASSIICPANFTANPLDANVCVPQCTRDAFHSTQQKRHTESLILGLSAVCFVLTLFSLVTFWAEPTRFGYPERPVLFLCLCYNLFSVCYLERIVFHNSTRSSLAMLEDPMVVAKLALPCALAPPCLASYITTSYLSLCAATWWLIFALCFYLSSHKKWSSEALEKRSGLFHVLAWVPPLAPPIAALLLERVRPSELTGMCTAPGFVELPALALLLLGLFFTLRASRSLHTLQKQMQPTFGHQRFSQIRKRFLVFSLVYFVPTIASMISTLFERNVDIVPSCSTLEDCAPPPHVSAWPTLVRIFFQLASGTLTGMWVWSRKTCESYRSRLIASPTSTMTTTTTATATNTTIKSLPAALHKKQLYASGKAFAAGGHGAPLYAGISFHNVPVYNPNQSRV